MQPTDHQMIRRIDVQMTREPRMPFASYACPHCGDRQNVQAAGERECPACSAPLKLLMPRDR